MITVKEAASLLRKHFGYHADWLQAIGVAEHEDRSEIHIYLAKRTHPSLKFLYEDGWMGFPVKVTYIGKVTVGPARRKDG